MVSKNQLKLITSLQQKKFRVEYRLFVAEGVKVIREFLQTGYVLKGLYATSEDIFVSLRRSGEIVSELDMKKMSSFVTPSEVLAVFEMPESKPFEERGLILVVDQLRDPGNLGTIIRLCDWFGVETLLCSTDSVDVYNPKTIQSTMGSLARVNVVALDIASQLQKTKLPIFGAYMEGESVYDLAVPTDCYVVLGNESNGITSKIGECITQAITIPRLGKIQQTESLNVATAGAILLSEMCRKINGK